MAKVKKKSLASLIGNREIKPEEIEKATAKVHGNKESKEKKPPKPKPAAPPKPVAKKKEKEKKIRVSVDTPVSLYVKTKEAALEEGMSSLKDFMLHCVTTYLKGKGKL